MKMTSNMKTDVDELKTEDVLKNCPPPHNNFEQDVNKALMRDGKRM